MTTRRERHTTSNPELPHTIRADKLRYGIFGTHGAHEVWLLRSPNPVDFTLINQFESREDARAAVARYIRARKIARTIGCRL